MAASKSTGGVLGLLWRLGASSILNLAMLCVYTTINELPYARTTVVMPSWVPFWPVFAVPYLLMLLFIWVAPITIADTRRFWACLSALACAYLLITPWWIWVPTTLPRSPMPVGWGSHLYRGIANIDAPNNVMPCAHSMAPMVLAWFVGRDHPTWRWPLVGILAVGISSIIFIWQHRPIDILFGTIAAAIAIAGGEALYRDQRTHPLKSVNETSIDQHDGKKA
jgi:hypothetical protein